MNSAFEKYNPWTCFIYILGVIILSMIMLHPVTLGLGVAIMLMVHYVLDRGKGLRLYLKFYLVICLLCALINPVFSHRGERVLFYFKGQSITLEAVIYGIAMGLSLFIILSAFNLFQSLVASDKLMYLFSKFMPTTTLVLMLSLRNIPLLKKRITDIKEVQISQGISIKNGTVWQRSQTAMETLNILVGWSLEEIMQTACSIRSRGYGIEKKRSFFFKYKLEKRDMTCIGMEVLLFFSTLLLWRMETYTIYPYFHLFSSFGKTAGLCILYTAYMSIPLWIEGWENYKWRLLK